MNQNRALCTIIAKNYIAFARTLAQSFRAGHPDCKCYVLIVDDFDGYIVPAEEGFDVVKLTDLKIPDLLSFCFKYDVKEVCTAAKAAFLDHLIREKGVERLLYLDPDILVTGSLDGLYEKLGTHDIVLTPHLDTDYPDDDLLPDDGYILRAGQFNLGFIGINAGENALAFLNWWKPKLLKHCFVDLLNGYFVDQKFIDFVPTFFQRVGIENDRGCNVAYWNLHSRHISKQGDTWCCNDGPLYFFHFSGYDPEGATISIHIPDSVARYRFSTRRDLVELFADYKDLLMKNGYQQTSAWPYTFGTFKSGEPIPVSVRRYYRSVPNKWRRLGDPFAAEELKLAAGNTLAETHTEQLDAILNSRAWRWVSRYGRMKNRVLRFFSRRNR
jgi:hypothetical protein